MPNPINACTNCDTPAAYGQTFCSTSCEIEYQMRQPGGALGGTACPDDGSSSPAAPLRPKSQCPNCCMDLDNERWQGVDGKAYCCEACAPPAPPGKHVYTFQAAEVCFNGIPLGTPLPIKLNIATQAAPVLSTDNEERKKTPIFSGLLNYFPLACAAVARLSFMGNEKHNPGQMMHWAREKSTDHADCIVRHQVDYETLDPQTGEYLDAMGVAWRAMAQLQLLEEKRLGKPPSRGSR